MSAASPDVDPLDALGLDAPGLDAPLAAGLARDRRLATGALVLDLVDARARGATLARVLVAAGRLPAEEARARVVAAQGARLPEVAGHALVLPLGRGGMGEVWLVEHRATGALRALKRLLPGADAELRLRFAREAEAMARVDAHPHLARVHAAGVDDGRPWLATDLLPGGDLAARLERGPLAPAEAARLGAALARGLAHAHRRGVLHRDVTPRNVLFDDRGQPRLVDLGLARVAGAAALTRTGTTLGTPAYMAPEQALGAAALDARADVWGLGAVLYHALAGRPPFEGPSPVAILSRVAAGEPPPPLAALAPGCPPALAEVVTRALEPDPARRWPTAEALAEALEAAARSEAAGRGRARGAGAAAAGLLVTGGLLLAAAGAARRPAPALHPAPAPVGSSVPPGPPRPDPRADAEAALAAALEGRAPGPALARAAALPDDQVPWPAVAAALLVVEGDRDAARPWTDRAARLPEGPDRAALEDALAVAAGRTPREPRGAALVAAEAARRALLDNDHDVVAALDPALLLRPVEGLAEALPRAPAWAARALAVRAAAALLAAPDAVLGAALYAGDRVQRAVEAVRRAAAPGAWAAALDVYLLHAAWRARPPGVPQPGAARYAVVEEAAAKLPPGRARATTLVLGRALALLARGDRPAPPPAAALTEGWATLVREGAAARVLDADGRPLRLDAQGRHLDEDGQVVPDGRGTPARRPQRQSPLARVCLAARRVVLEAWIREGWAAPPAARDVAVAQARAHAAAVAGVPDERNACICTAAVALLAGAPDEALAALSRSPCDHDDLPRRGVLVDVWLALDQPRQAEADFEEVAAVLDGPDPTRELDERTRAYLTQQRALVDAACGRLAEAHRRLDALAAQGVEVRHGLFPWRTRAEVARQVRYMEERPGAPGAAWERLRTER